MSSIGTRTSHIVAGLTMVVLISVPSSSAWAQESEAWGFDGEESSLAGDWSMGVDLTLSGGCSQSWEHTVLEGAWNMQVNEEGTVSLSLELAGESSIGSRQSSQDTSKMVIEEKDWHWSGQVHPGDAGPVLKLAFLPDGTCTKDRAELGLCMMDAPLELHCEEPEERVLRVSLDKKARHVERTVLVCDLADDSRIGYPVRQVMPESRLYLALDGGAHLSVFEDVMALSMTLLAVIDP